LIFQANLTFLLNIIYNKPPNHAGEFWGRGIYFVIGNVKLWEMSNDAP
jgi:hypothetical protein